MKSHRINHSKKRSRWIALLILAVFALVFPLVPAWADFPYPAPPDGVNPEHYAAYTHLPKTSPPVRPNDFTGSDTWKLTSDQTGDPTIDHNPQELYGVEGARVDLAWQVTTGRPDVVIAVLDSGIIWQDPQPDLDHKFWLNKGELPLPENALGKTKTTLIQEGAHFKTSDPYDLNDDGVFDVRDYAQDPRVQDFNHNGVIDPEDLIHAFADGKDNDHDGYVDDIAGWDFFENDNNPRDEVRYGHGTGESKDSSAEANNGQGTALGVCPNCRVMVLRVGDSFITDANLFAQAVVYAVDHGANVIQEALGTLNNTSAARKAIEYAYAHGVPVIASAADEEAAHHNYPSNNPHTIVVNSVNKYNPTQYPHSYLYLNGCTNYGGKITVSVPSSSCSSEATGRASGMAGLIVSAAKDAVDKGLLSDYPLGNGRYAPFPLSANEIKQIMAMTADDIDFADPVPNYVTENVVPSQRYPSIRGWDQYFGYGRVNAARMVQTVALGRIPPEASIDNPDWFSITDPDHTDRIPVKGRVSAVRATSYSYKVQVGIGVQPKEEDFHTVYQSGVLNAPRDGILANLSVPQLVQYFKTAGIDPSGTPNDAAGLPDVDKFAFTIRVQVTDNRGLTGEDRRQLNLHHDPDLVPGFPRQLGSDGDASPVFADLLGNGQNELIVATADGYVHAYRPDGSELPGWPVHTLPLPVHPSPAYSASAPASQRVGPVYASILNCPATGDLDGDGRLEVVASDLNGHVYVWNADGTLRKGFPVGENPAYLQLDAQGNDIRDHDNRVTQGFLAAPVLADLNRTGKLDIVAASLDRHVYAWNPDGIALPGWPVLLADPAKVLSVDPVTHHITFKPDAGTRIGAKIIDTPAIGDIDGDGYPEIVVGTNEEYQEDPNASAVSNTLGTGLNLVNPGGNTRLYVLYHDGKNHPASSPLPFPDAAAYAKGWPVKIALLKTELLPYVGTGISGPPVLADLNHDGKREIGVFGNNGPGYILNPDGSSYLGTGPDGKPLTLSSTAPGFLTLAHDFPTIPALGGGAFADLGIGTGVSFIAPGAGLGKLLDVVLNEKQSIAENHLLAWNLNLNTLLPGFPRVVNDLQFLTTPVVGSITAGGLPSILEGTANGDLHAVNGWGQEAPGWPKFTAGWVVASPAIGTWGPSPFRYVADTTREGNLFVWKTNGTASDPVPWPKYHHDLANTGDLEHTTKQ